MLSREQFKKRLKDAGWTQAKLARAMGKDPSWINKIIGGARGMNHRYLSKVAELTGIPPNELLGWKAGNATSPPEDEKMIREAVDTTPLDLLKMLVKFGRERLEKEGRKP